MAFQWVCIFPNCPFRGDSGQAQTHVDTDGNGGHVTVLGLTHA